MVSNCNFISGEISAVYKKGKTVFCCSKLQPSKFENHTKNLEYLLCGYCVSVPSISSVAHRRFFLYIYCNTIHPYKVTSLRSFSEANTDRYENRESIEVVFASYYISKK